MFLKIKIGIKQWYTLKVELKKKEEQIDITNLTPLSPIVWKKYTSLNKNLSFKQDTWSEKGYY